MKEFAVKALKWPRVLTFLIFFLPLNVNAAPVDSLVQSITPTTIASGKRAEINLTLSEEIDHISLMPGGPYVSDTISFPQDLGSIASDGERIFASGIHNEVFVISGPFGKLSESAVLLSEGKAKNIFPSGPALYFSNKTGLKKVKPNSRKIHKTVNIFDFEKDITSFIIDSKKAYLLLGKREVVVLDTGPPAPKVLGKYALSFDAYSVIVQKGTCYVASKMRGLTLLDIQNPEEISEIGSYKTTGPALDMAISGKFAFIADGWTGMTVLDVSAPEKVTWVSGLNNIGYSEKIEVEGTHTTIKNNLGEITVVDVQKPERPKTLERIAFKEEVQGFTLLNETLFVLQGNEVQKVRLKEARSPEYLNDGVNLGGSRRFFLRDHIAYVADWFSGLHLYDISIPNKPALLSNFHTPGSPKGVLVDGDLAFVGDDDHGLQIINISDPLHPSLISNLRMPGLAYTMKRRENLLYIAMHRGGFHIVDISDIKNPKIAGSFDTPGKSWSLEFSGKHLFVSDDSSGVLVFDVDDPQNIEIIGEFNPGGFAEDIFIDGDRAFTVFFDKGLYVLDISDPGNITQTAHLKTPGSARGIDVQGNYAYVADWFAGFHIIDVENPEKPRFISSYDTDGAAWGIQRRGRYLYVMDWWGGFKVFDVADLKNPKPVGQYHKRGRVLGISVRDNFAFLANGSGGFQVFDITNPLFPVWVAGVDLPGNAADITLYEDLALVSFGGGGFATINIKNPFEPALVSIRPTPGKTEKIAASREIIYVLDTQAGLLRYKIFPPGEPVQLEPLNGKFKDFTVSEGKIYIVNEAGEVFHLRPAGTRALTKRKIAISDPANLIRVSANRVFVSTEKGDVYLFNILEPGAQKDFVSVNDEIVDINATRNRLLVLGKNTGLMEFTLSSGKKPRLTALYSPLKRMTKIETTNSFAFLSGEREITSIKYLAEISKIRKNRDGVTLEMPPTLPVGSYNLVVAGNKKREIIRNAFRVRHTRTTPKFTLEDFKKILEERKAKQLKNNKKLKTNRLLKK